MRDILGGFSQRESIHPMSGPSIMSPVFRRFSQIAGALSVIFWLAVTASGQLPESRHFAKDGLSFDYPANWFLNDRSTESAQHLTITRPGTSLLIMVIAYREAIVSRDQLLTATAGITEPYIRSLVEKLSDARMAAKRESACAAIGDATIGGVQVRGVINNEPATAEVYVLPKGRRFVNLVYIRKNADDTNGASAWRVVRDTLRIDMLQADKPVDPNIDLLSGSIYAGGVLNGKALSLPRPEYSSFARAGGASGVVVVQVTIDETGKVIAAHAMSGHRLLYAASEDAARHARFSPTTLCGKPVKVNGTIIYNFFN